MREVLKPRAKAMAKLAILSCSLLVEACGSETAQDSSWKVTFACAAQREQSDKVKLSISPGKCASPAKPVYEATVARKGAGAKTPPDLKKGAYAFSATAYDSDGKVTAKICSDVKLPRKQGVALVLPGTEGCEPEPTSDTDGVPEMPGDTCETGCLEKTEAVSNEHISVPKPCWLSGESMPVTILMPNDSKDWLSVPNHPEYPDDGGFWDYTGITTAGEIYGGSTERPGGLKAPTVAGAYVIRWIPTGLAETEYTSELPFTVCPSPPM